MNTGNQKSQIFKKCFVFKGFFKKSKLDMKRYYLQCHILMLYNVYDIYSANVLHSLFCVTFCVTQDFVLQNKE